MALEWHSMCITNDYLLSNQPTTIHSGGSQQFMSHRRKLNRCWRNLIWWVCPMMSSSSCVCIIITTNTTTIIHRTTRRWTSGRTEKLLNFILCSARGGTGRRQAARSLGEWVLNENQFHFVLFHIVSDLCMVSYTLRLPTTGLWRSTSWGRLCLWAQVHHHYNIIASIFCWL